MMYEHISILKEDLSKNEIEKEIKKYKKYFQENNISVESFENIGIKKLVYEIKNYKTGNYLFYKIWTEKDKIIELEKFERANENVIKFITVSSKEKPIESLGIIEKINKSDESFLFKGIADYIVAQLENENEDGRNIKFDIKDVKKITENVLNDESFFNILVNTISSSIDERFPKQENEEESEEEI